MPFSLRRLDLNRPIRTSQTPYKRVSKIACLAASFVIALSALCPPLHGENARFDLTGPKVELRVTRAGMTLPIASVPNLQPGDRLWVHPDLPASQSIHYLMVLVFLRGTTNPPPDDWFIRIQAWDKKVRAEGVEVPVPDEAQQAVLLLAPVTGGDFSTLRSAVQGRPGIFVRAAQDLDLAGFEQARIEKYIASMREVPQAELSDPKALQEHSNLIAGILALKPNGDCVKLPPDQQYTCLTQSGSQNLLDDGHGQTLVNAIASGPSSDFINAASATSLAGGGVYSAYVGAIVDLVRIMGSLHTAHYQYIPAIAFPQEAALNLRLNTAPSFNNPKSVIVIGLPAIQATSAPPLRPTDPKAVSCLKRPGLTLPVEGAPLVYSTGFAHDLVLHINYPEGSSRSPDQPQDIPLRPDAFKGGLVVGSAPERKALPIAKTTLPKAVIPTAKPDSKGPAVPDKPRQEEASAPPAELTGTIQGYWGFDTFQGPTMPLQRTPGHDWKVAGHEPLIAGHDGTVDITSTGTACIESITLDPAPGKHQSESWKPADKPNTVSVALKLSELPANDPRTLQLAIRQFGTRQDATVSLVSYSEPAKLTGLDFHAGDPVATLSGTSLDQVKELHLATAIFTPAGQGGSAPNTLRFALAKGAPEPAAAAGDKLTAEISLKDGRTLTLPTTVAPPRPTVELISKAALPAAVSPGGLPIKLASANDLPLVDSLTFALKSPRPLPRNVRIEVASPDASLHANLNVEAANLIIEDPTTVLGKLDPLKTFGASAFGPIQVRAVAPDGTSGDWIPLATLVRLPTITSVSCPAAPASATPPAPADSTPTKPASDTPPGTSTGAANPAAPAVCTLTGSDLFLIDSVAADAAFTNPTRVPEGFVQNTIAIPAPTTATVYLKLRDDSAAIDSVDLPAPLGTTGPNPTTAPHH